MSTHIVQQFVGKHVLLIGDVMLDEYIWGTVRRISPEAPVPVVEYERRTCQPGGAANTAANVVNLGGRVSLAGIVGTDTQGDQLLTLLRSSGMNVDGVIAAEERWTTTKTRLLAHNQQVVRLDYERPHPLSAGHEDELLRWLERNVARADACVLSDYSKGLVSPRLAEQVIHLALKHGKPVLVDPKGTNFTKYRGATLIKPNSHEVERVLHHEVKDDADLAESGRRMLEMLPGSAVLITRGSQGMSLFRAGLPTVHIPSIARNVYDVTGAGDTVAGVLALSLAIGADLEPAARLANQAAGIVVGKLGTAQVTAEELLANPAS